MSYINGAVTVTSTAAVLCNPNSGSGGVLVQNTGSSAVYVGGPNVTSSGATQGLSIAAAATVLVPTLGESPRALYAVTASGTATVVFLYPSA